MDRECSIKVESVSKKFGTTLRSSMLYGIRDSVRRLCGLKACSEQLGAEEFWALNHVSFEIRRGEGFAVMGTNGSGKTTLLRILSGIFHPDAGQVSLRGRVGALIAVGAGFAPMLTGRENIYVNGALLGMEKVEIDSKVDEILEFSGIGAFADLPVKHYSSGMVVRLGFAVAVFSKPDILLIDEVLAVGDLSFQKKCYEYLQRLREQGTSIVLVTHAVGAAWAMCQRGILLDKGEIRTAGSIDDIIRAYQDLNAANSRISAWGRAGGDNTEEGEIASLPRTYGGLKGGTGDVFITHVSIHGRWAHSRQGHLNFREPFVIEAHIQTHLTIREPVFRFSIDAAHYKYITCLDNIEENHHFGVVEPGSYRMQVVVSEQNLMPGSYRLNVAVCQKGLGGHLYFDHGVSTFQVMQPQDRLLYAEDTAVFHLESTFNLSASPEAEVRSLVADNSVRPRTEQARFSKVEDGSRTIVSSRRIASEKRRIET